MNSADRPDDNVLAGEYALGLLEGRELETFERRLARERSLQEEVARWRERLSPLDATASPGRASPQLWDKIESSLATRRGVVDTGPSWSERLWTSLGFWRGAGLAGAAASVLLAISVGMLAGRATPQPLVVAVLQTGDASPGAIVEAFHDGSVVLVPLRDIPVPPGRALEVWTLYDKARGPVSLGLMDSARRFRFQTASLPAQADQLYEITLEPATGSPIGRPTGPVLMKGLAAVPRL